MAFLFSGRPRTGRLLPPLAGTRGRRIGLLVMCIIAYLLGFSHHTVVWTAGTAPSSERVIFHNIVVLLCYGTLWFLFTHYFRQRQSSPGKILWTTLLFGLTLLGVGNLLTSLGGHFVANVDAARNTLLGSGPVDFDYNNTDIPLTFTAVLKMNLLSLLMVGFAFMLLLRLRDLVLYKRTRTSERNWYLMLAFMLLAAFLAILRPLHDAFDIVWLVSLVPPIVLMVINSFRLSWIVSLSFKEKMIISGLALLLLSVLLGSLTDGSEFMVGAIMYIAQYSYPLWTFTLLALVFGILYCTTALLSLVFHLPTTGDYQRKAGELAAIQSLTQLVSHVFDAQRLFSTIAASPVDARVADAAWLVIPEVEHGLFRPRIVATNNTTPAHLEELIDLKALYDEVQSTRQPLLLEQAPADHRIKARPGEGIGSLIAVPLISRESFLGALFVTKDVAHGFEKDDTDAISVFGAQASIALDNSRLFNEKVERERLARELDIAREVQQKLLPQHLPQMDGISLAASSVSAQEVGGDYYDVNPLDDERMAFIIADVSGKGTSAAFYMAEMQGIFHSLSRLAPTPTDFLCHANKALASSLEKNVFISVIYGVLDWRTEELVLARAGHCPAATINLTGEARYLRTRGLGLGLDRGTLFQRSLGEERIRLQPGDVFVLYTDGVVESRNAEGEEYGYERLLTSLREHRHEDAQDLHDALIHDLQTFIGNEAYDDDMTLLVLKWHGIALPEIIGSHMVEMPEAVLEDAT